MSLRSRVGVVRSLPSEEKRVSIPFNNVANLVFPVYVSRRTLGYGLVCLFALVIHRRLIGIVAMPWSLHLMLADFDLLLMLVKAFLVEFSSF